MLEILSSWIYQFRLWILWRARDIVDALEKLLAAALEINYIAILLIFQSEWALDFDDFQAHW